MFVLSEGIGQCEIVGHYVSALALLRKFLFDPAAEKVVLAFFQDLAGLDGRKIPSARTRSFVHDRLRQVPGHLRSLSRLVPTAFTPKKIVAFPVTTGGRLALCPQQVIELVIQSISSQGHVLSRGWCAKKGAQFRASSRNTPA